MKEPSIVFYEESKKALRKAVCEWAGVPLPEENVEKRANQLSDLFESVAQIKPKFAKGVISRKMNTKWVEDLILKVRDGKLRPDNETVSRLRL